MSSIPIPYFQALIPNLLASGCLILTLFRWFVGDYLRINHFINFGTFLNDQAVWHMLFAKATWLYWSTALFVFLALMGLSFRPSTKTLSWGSLRANPWVTRMLSAGYIATCFLSFDAKDPILVFGRSVLVYQRLHGLAFSRSIGSSAIAFANDVPAVNVSGAGKVRPNVFVVILESFPSYWVGRTENSLKVTPFLESLANSAWQVSNFYANGTYTINGHIDILASQYPPLVGSLAERYSNVKVRGLPGILSSNGYDTWFLTAQDDVMFGNEHDMMKRLGVEHILSSVVGLKTNQLNEVVWGWGMQDDAFYEASFRFLAARDSRKPVFAVMAPVVNHYPYDLLPRKYWTIFPNPENMYQRFANSVHFSDACLSRFFTLLQQEGYSDNSIVVITADHAMPVGIKDQTGFNSFFYDEDFAVPCFFWGSPVSMLHKGNAINPCKDWAFSHVDISPSILFLLGIAPPPYFRGSSIFAPSSRKPALLVQQSSDLFLLSIRFPHKYVYNVTTGKELLFSLAPSPDLPQENPEEFSTFRNDVALLMKHHWLIENNKLLRELQ